MTSIPIVGAGPHLLVIDHKVVPSAVRDRPIRISLRQRRGFPSQGRKVDAPAFGWRAVQRACRGCPAFPQKFNVSLLDIYSFLSYVLGHLILT
jgi:hypothetical protein